MPRETPLSLFQLDNMRRAVEAGPLLPAMPGFYHGVTTIQDLVDFIVSRICDQLGVCGDGLINRWGSVAADYSCALPSTASRSAPE